MKNVLLTTTALVAFAGSAFAAAHGGGTSISLSGSADLGYNDDIEGGIFADSDFTVAGEIDLGDGITATISYGVEIDNSAGNFNATGDEYPTIEVLSAFGSLKFGDLDDEGASEYFYSDRDGMAQDVENHDAGDDAAIRALIEYGDYGFAVGCEDLAGSAANTSDSTCEGINYGAGATFGNISVGLGFDDADNGTATTAVSVDYASGPLTAGLSYATGTEDSIGVAVGYEISPDLSVDAFYANNSVASDAYGVSVDYTSGAIGVGAYFERENTGTDKYGLDVSYDVNADLTAFVGVQDAGTTEYYVGVEYTINDSISATVSYATADEISGPEFKDGTSVFLSLSF